MDDDGRALAICEWIEQDVNGIRRTLVLAGDGESDPLLQAASAVEACQTLRRHCNDLYRALVAQALDSGVSPRVLDLPGG